MNESLGEFKARMRRYTITKWIIGAMVALAIIVFVIDPGGELETPVITEAP